MELAKAIAAGLDISGGKGSETGDGDIIISSISYDYVAALNGRLHKGDQIIAVNSISMLGKSQAETLERIRSGDAVNLKVLKATYSSWKYSPVDGDPYRVCPVELVTTSSLKPNTFWIDKRLFAERRENKEKYIKLYVLKLTTPALDASHAAMLANLEMLLSVDDLHHFRDLSQVEIDGSSIKRDMARRLRDDQGKATAKATAAVPQSGSWYGWWYGRQASAPPTIPGSSELRVEHAGISLSPII